MLLAIDTSTRYAGVALLNNEDQIAQLLQWRSQQNHTVELLPAIELVLKREHISIQDITSIAIAIGPGSFSALRVGISIAKSIAWSMGLPLVPVTTLEAEAFAYCYGSTTVCAVLDAGRNQVAWALFEEKSSQQHQSISEQITDPAELLDILPTPTLLCGEGLERYGETLSNNSPDGIRLALPYLPSQRVAAIACLGNVRFQEGQTQKPDTVQPLYLRRPTITEPRQQSSSTAHHNR